MRTMMKATTLMAMVFALTLQLAHADQRTKENRETPADHRTFEITFTNISHGIILTPPIFSVSHRKIDIFELGEPASLGLEMVAEGGSTNELKGELEAEGVQDLVQAQTPVPPGKSITVELEGDTHSRLNLASMLLPTNDGFVALNGKRLRRGGTQVIYLSAYDAGTEENDESCDNIPGPQCGGEGFNEADGEGFVVPHAGIHGEAELKGKLYSWGDPVAMVTIRVSK